MMKFGKLKTLGTYNHEVHGEVMITDYYPVGENPVYGDERNAAALKDSSSEPHYKVQQTGGRRAFSYVKESELIEIPTEMKFIAKTWDPETKKYCKPVRNDDEKVKFFESKQELNDYILENGISCAVDEVDILTYVDPKTEVEEEVEETEE